MMTLQRLYQHWMRRKLYRKEMDAVVNEEFPVAFFVSHNFVLLQRAELVLMRKAHPP